MLMYAFFCKIRDIGYRPMFLLSTPAQTTQGYSD